MEESLSNWVYKTCQELLNLQVNLDTNLNHLIIQFSHYLIQERIEKVENYQTLIEIQRYFLQLLQLEEIFSSSFSSSSSQIEIDIYFLIKLLLKYVVSSICNERERFVSFIITLDPIIQEYLMEAIQSIPDGQLSMLLVTNEEEDNEITHKSSISISTSTTTTSTTNHSNLEYYCNNCHLYKIELEKYQKEIKSCLEREKGLEEQNKNENSLQMHKIMDLESLVTEKKIEIREIKDELEILQKKDIDNQNKLKEKKDLERKVYELQEQVDSLIQMSKRAEIAEKQVEKMKDKIERLDRVNELLQAETQAHNETHSTLLQLEQEVTTLRTTKHHLEEYRKRCIENEIIIKDLQLQIVKYETINNQLQHDLQNKIEGNQVTFNQTKLLTKELLDVTETLRECERGVGVGKELIVSSVFFL